MSRALLLSLAVATAVAAVALGAMGASLRTSHAPQGLISLTLADSADAAAALESWRGDRRLMTRARRALALDYWFIPLYAMTLVLLAARAAGTRVLGTPRRRWWTVGVVAAVAIAAWADVQENRIVMRLLDGAEASQPEMAALRRFAWLKFGFVLAVLPAALATIVALLVTTLVRDMPDVSTVDARERKLRAAMRRYFWDYVRDEHEAIFGGHAAPLPLAPRAVHLPPLHTPKGVAVGESGEPWLRQAPGVVGDLVGLALSGGGIRSATFSLGVLQVLQRFGVLQHVHYLSTVSGGGYLGGFWSAWRLHNPGFPASAAGQEPRPLRHLREFSRFLVPRTGFLEAETWSAIAAVLGGLVPALITGMAVIAAAVIGWLAVAMVVPWSTGGAQPLYVALLTLLALAMIEADWRRSGRSDAATLGARAYAFSAMAAVVFAAALHVLWLQAQAGKGSTFPYGNESTFPYYEQCTGSAPAPGSAPAAAPWRRKPSGDVDAHLGLLNRARPDAAGDRSRDCLHFSARLFDLSVAWLGAGLALIILRFVMIGVGIGLGAAVGAATPAARPHPTVRAVDRVIQRVLALGTINAAAATAWLLGRNLGLYVETQIAVATGAAGAAGAFTLLRRWMLRRLSAPRSGGPRSKVWRRLPQLLAYVAVGLAIVMVAGILIDVSGAEYERWLAAAMLVGLVLALGLLIEPHELGLHAFYRSRIIRAYLGAFGGQTRYVEPRADDDVYLKELRGRPLHLVCCAANDLGGDPLPSLHRGARSATLSRVGVAIAGRARPPGRITLGDALTASAAALNANMGSFSARLGPAATFLLATLNLRLGLWVRHPWADAADGSARLPRSLFYRELFGRTRAGVDLDGRALSPYVHLSDGGHFENLALYELVRRHCRFVIVSDGGADPDLSFNDFGNAVRRIREDFGVEIDIDLSPLRRVDGPRSRQHAVVGTIRYDAAGDQGVLVYFKPTLTGDEPADVEHYQTANPAFPHESTVDQFYDEAQWEAYRRLGEHAAETVFRFVATEDVTAPSAIFSGARWRWYPTPEGLEQRVLEATRRYTEIERDLAATLPTDVLCELFPELGSGGSGASRPAPGLERQTLLALVRMVQLMEDVYRACSLDVAWNHPLNMGWLTVFYRWAGARSFRRWWPILRPMYSTDFTDFLERRLPTLKEGVAWQPRLTATANGVPAGLATAWLAMMSSPADITDTSHAFTFDAESEGLPVQVGIVYLDIDEQQRAARWDSEGCFVPPTLWGTGIGSRMVRELLRTLESEGIRRCDVRVDRKHAIPLVDPGTRAEHADLVTFYRGLGFKLSDQADTAGDVLTRRM